MSTPEQRRADAAIEAALMVRQAKSVEAVSAMLAGLLVRNAELSAQAEMRNPNTPFLLDCNGREVLVGDVIRVKHFTTRHGRGHKQHWMYKLVIERLVLGSVNPMPALKILSLQDPAKKPHHYYEKLDGSLNEEIEIVNGLNADASGRMVNFDQRPRRRPNGSDEGRRNE